MTLGLAGPFARPARTAAMLAAVAFGTMTATFALGLTSSLNAVGAAENRGDSTAAVLVRTFGPPTGGVGGPGGAGAATGGITLLSAADDLRVSAAIQSQPGTASFYGERAGRPRCRVFRARSRRTSTRATRSWAPPR
ncbi:hypothetical protein ABIA33_000240 [Streptacidiphilus sp. MAP12-16]|uniref:hypothetical protein n=1 Tax=Streptacidiphilus sp. MAP12-16 TaxID=3156300 RepID=UPI003511F6D6